MSVNIPNAMTSISIKALIANNKLAISYNQALAVQAQNAGQILWVDPNTLHIDHSYQRNLNTRHAMKIANGFNHLNMKPATGFRDTKTGIIYITDGQHTVTAAALCGLSKVPVYVHDLPVTANPTQVRSMQSNQFLSINQSNKPVSRFDIYRNKLIQQDPEFMAIDAMCKRVGVTPCLSSVTNSKTAGALSHIKNLETAWFNIGNQATEDALVFMRKYFPTEAIHGGMMVGIAFFIKKMSKYAGRPNAVWDPALLANALSQNGTKTLPEIYEELHELNKDIGHYGASATTQQWVAGMIRETYNENIRTNSLSETQLGKYC